MTGQFEVDDGPDPGRVAEVVVGGRRSGLGYLVATGTVLTAARLVTGGGGVAPAVRLGGREVPTTVAWQHRALGVALLALPETGPEVAPARLGRLGEVPRQPVPCGVAGGPPDVTPTLVGARDGGRLTALEVVVDGVSGAELCGAAVFAGPRLDWLVGVVAGDAAREPVTSHVGRWAEVLRAKGNEAGLRRLQGLLGGATALDALPEVTFEPHVPDGPAASQPGGFHNEYSGSADRVVQISTAGTVNVYASPGSPPTAAGPQPPAAPQPTPTARRLPPGVRTHQQELRRGANRQKYLTGDRIPFVRPGDGDHPTDPDRLWARLSATSPDTPGDGYPDPVRGVLLVGPAGAGKTRTCFEVADRAERAGWEVLHVAAEAHVTAVDLVEVITAPPRRSTLLVFDYLDRYAELSLTHLVDELEVLDPPAPQVACIASVRPGGLAAAERRHNPRRLFQRLDICQDADHQQAVSGSILESVAHTAVRRFGREAIARLCGQRPAIALMRARAIEAEVRDREEVRLAELDAMGGDELLSSWLQRRTEEDLASLQATAGDHRTTVLAATVAVAACPQDRETVQQAVRVFLDRHQTPTPLSAGAEGVVGGLVRTGWLLESHGSLEADHDIVVDEFLRKACFPDGVWFHAEAAMDLVTAAHATPGTRTLRRLADHVRRWAGDLEPAARAEVRMVCDRWLAAHAAELGERLAAPAHLQAGRHTLLTLLSGEPWQSGAVATWDQLVGPWLRVAGRTAPGLVRQLFTDAIRNIADDVPAPLAAAAVAWLDDHPVADGSRDVVEALVRASNLRLPDESPRRAGEPPAVVGRAVDWLASNEVGPRNRSVLAALLARDDLPPAVLDRVVKLGLTGVRRHLSATATAHLLRPLLERHDLTASQLDRVLRLAHEWLDTPHGREPAASFVVRPLLQRTDAGPGWNARAIDRALAWVTDRGTDRVASFVFRHLLGHADLTADDAAAAATQALRWLDRHGLEAEASFVLSAVLSRDDLDQAQLVAAARHAVAWLDRHGTGPTAGYVFSRLLARRLHRVDPRQPDGRQGEADRAGQDGVDQDGVDQDGAGDRVVDQALAWLRTYGTTELARSVVPPLLDIAGPHGDRACAAALAWLDADDNATSPDACFVLDPLLVSSGLEGASADAAAGHALAWLAVHGTDATASFVLKSLLRCRHLTAERAAPALDAACAWLRPRHTDPEARFVLGAALGARQPVGRAPAHRDGQAPEVTFALAWLGEEHNATADHAAYVLAPLLERLAELAEADAATVVDRALAWLGRHERRREAELVIRALLRGLPSDAEARVPVADAVLRWLADRPAELTPNRLAHLARLHTLPPELDVRLAELVLAQLRPRDSGSAAGRLLPSALRHENIRPDQLADLADHAMWWLDRLPAERTRKTLRSLLLRTAELDAERVARLVTLTRAWLAEDGGSTYAGRIIATALRQSALGPDLYRELVGSARDWLAHNGTHTYAGDLLLALLEGPDGGGPRPELPAELRTDCVDRALAWLGSADRADERVPRLMALLIDRQ